MKIEHFEISTLEKNLNVIYEKKIIVIEHGCQKETLIFLNEKILNKSIKLVLVWDENSSKINLNLVRNLDVLNYLDNITEIAILAHSNIELKEVDNVKNIKQLNRFKLSGFYSGNINLEFLVKFKELKTLEIEHLKDVQKYKLLQNFNLEELSIDSLDLAKVATNTLLKSLTIIKSLENENLLSSKFPNLIDLTLIKCSKITDFSFLEQLKYLESITQILDNYHNCLQT